MPTRTPPLVSPPPAKTLRSESSSLDIVPESSGLSTPTYDGSNQWAVLANNNTNTIATTTTTPLSASTTPARKLGSINKQTNNNYSAPHTPIASAKRPRQPASGKSNFGNVVVFSPTTNSEIASSSSTKLTATANCQSANKLEDIQEHSSEDTEYGHDHLPMKNPSVLLSPVGKMKPLEEGDGLKNEKEKGDDLQEEYEKDHYHEEDEEHVAYHRTIVPNARLLSPMHPAKPLTKQNLVHDSSNTTSNHGMDPSPEPVKSKFKTLNKIFSPVLNFLSSSSSSTTTTTTTNFLSPTKNERVEERVVVEDEYFYMKSIPDEDGDVYMQDEESPIMQQFHLSYEEKVEMTSSTSYVECIQEEKHQPSEPEEEHDDDDNDNDDVDEFNPYYFIKNLPAYHHVVPDPTKKIHLPPKDPLDPSISLVLDLDETLVHCTIDPISDPDMTFPVFFNGMQYTVYVRTRPYLMDFLEAVADRFEVVVFTASQKVYANELLDRIDPGTFLRKCK